ncbi:glycoside hydrolase family 75 protein [Agrobacterium sp. DE0009]|uniref:glycoside hydrolase family 75 protein n=1 Tax=Agrobacterium sp. DE0009 TaxID=2587505 RepID=UPI0011A05F45|nr:glycoside hydrolase family 75 protein [Agrobacterium sp. DE0009]
MSSFMPVRMHMFASLLGVLLAIQANAAEPPTQSAGLLNAIDFSLGVPLDENYRLAFQKCDGTTAERRQKDHFLGFDLKLPNVPDAKQYYLCSRDPSNVRALLRLGDGAVYWRSKMALDVDGSWAAWNGLPGATDLKETAYKWPGSGDPSARSAQINPDRIPYIVIPTAGLSKITGSRSSEMGRMFADKTGLSLGDMGVVVYKDQWTPVLIGDGGPFMRLGEGSSRVFEAIGESRCKKWSNDGQTCVGSGNVYPYKNHGLGGDVIFIAYPGSRSADINPQNAISKLCAFAKEKLKLTGGRTCP